MTLVLTSGAVTALQRPPQSSIPQEFGAAGAPYVDPAYCKDLADLVNRFEGTVLPKQARDIEQQEARLSEAEAGRAEAEQEYYKALRDGLIKLGEDQMATAKVLRARVRAMKTLTGPSRDGVVNPAGLLSTDRRVWLERIKNIEDTGRLLKVGVARADYAELVRQNQDNLVSFMKLVDESGAADIALKGLANTIAPGIGGLVVGGIKVGMDWVYAYLKGRFTAQEAAQYRDSLDKLKAAHEDLKDRVDGYRQDLTGGLCGPKVAQQVQNSPKPIPPQQAATVPSTPPPPSTPLPEPERRKGPSGAQAATLGLGLAAAGGAGYLAYKYAMEAVELEGDSDTGSSGGSMTRSAAATTPGASSAVVRIASSR